MNHGEFNKWIDIFLKEKGIDRKEVFKIIKNGDTHIFEIEHVVDMLKLTDKNGQNKIKKILIKTDYNNADIRRNYVIYII